MPNRQTLRECPERTDDRAPLFAHQISLDLCGKRQGAQYHKCFSCAHFRSEAHPVPAPLKPLSPPREAERVIPGPVQSPAATQPELVPARLKVG